MNRINEDDGDQRNELETAIRTVFKFLYADNQWYRLPKVLHKITPTYYPEAEERRAGKKPKQVKLKIAAYTLAAMLNQANVQDGHDGWFKFSTKKTQEDTGFCRKTQYNHIYFLQRCKLVYCPARAKEVRGRREVKINYMNLYHAIQEVADSGVNLTQAAKSSGVNLTRVNGVSGVNLTQPLGKNLPESCRKKNTARTEKERNTRSASQNGIHTHPEPSHSTNKKGKNRLAGLVDTLPPVKKKKEEAPEEIAALARRLWDVAMKMKGIRLFGKLANWSKKLLTLERALEEGGRKRLLRVLNWYCENPGANNGPIISGPNNITVPTFTWLEALRDKTKKAKYHRDPKQRDDDPRYRKEYI